MIQMRDLWQEQSVQTAREYVLMIPSLKGGRRGQVLKLTACVCKVLRVGMSAAILPILQYAHMLCVHNAQITCGPTLSKQNMWKSGKLLLIYSSHMHVLKAHKMLHECQGLMLQTTPMHKNQY